MGFLDTIRAMFSEKKTQLETVDLPFAQIDVFVSQHSDKIKGIEQKAYQFKQELNDRFKNIRVQLEILKRAEPDSGISASKLCVVGKSIRDNFYDNAYRAISSLPEGVQDFYLKSQDAFKVLNLDMRKAEILLMVFKKEMTDFSKVLVDLKKELDVFKKFVKRDLTVIRKYDELKEVVEKAKASKKDISKAKDELSRIKEELDFLESKKQGILEQLVELQASKKSSEVIELDKEAKELEDKNKAICSEIDTKFSELKKPLKKFEYLVSQGKYSANQRSIKEYLKSPSQAVLNDYKLNIIKILVGLTKAFGKDINLDEKQQIQMPLIIESLTEDYFRKKQEEHKVNHGLLQENYSQKTQILTPLVFKERSLEREIKALDRNLEEIQKDYDKHDKILAKHKEFLENRFNKLSSLISDVTDLPVQVND